LAESLETAIRWGILAGGHFNFNQGRSRAGHSIRVEFNERKCTEQSVSSRLLRQPLEAGRIEIEINAPNHTDIDNLEM
jgi:hypothetical protein